MTTPRPIFIHSLFRTGSTYIWNKFRGNGAFHCFYEPFHQELALLGSESSYRWGSEPRQAEVIGHPLLDREYMHEYRHLLVPGKPGVPHFRKSFSFDDFFRLDRHPRQKKYIEHLLAHAPAGIPLLQFNRSAMRVAWFKKYFPGAFHVYQLRDPRQQFNSFLSLRDKAYIDIFLTMNLLTVGVNMRSNRLCKELGRRLPLSEFHAGSFSREEEFYRRSLSYLSRGEHYLVHYAIWFAALLENLVTADLLLNIDVLSSDESYRHAVSRRFAEAAGERIDFSDAACPHVPVHFMPEDEISRIEAEARTLVLKLGRQNYVSAVLPMLAGAALAPFRFSPEKFLAARCQDLPARPDKKEWIARRSGILERSRPQVDPQEALGGLRGGLRLQGTQKKSRPGQPLVTVVTVVLNETYNLERTLDSVLRQTYANIEIIVIDGGSAQPTMEVIKKYADKIDCWLSEPDRGIFDAMNKGIALAGGDWINFLNCGDRFYRDDTLQTVFSRDFREADFIYGHTDFQGGDFHGPVKAWDLSILWKTMVFTHQSLFSRSAVMKERNFNTAFRICADFDLIYNAWADGLKFFNCNAVIASFHPGFSDVSRAKMAWEKWLVVRRHRHDLRFHLFYLQLFSRRLLRDVKRRLQGRWTTKGRP
jgi:hypothetical protein